MTKQCPLRNFDFCKEKECGWYNMNYLCCGIRIIYGSETA
jgi:hypothetical protein